MVPGDGRYLVAHEIDDASNITWWVVPERVASRQVGRPQSGSHSPDKPVLGHITGTSTLLRSTEY